MYVVAALLLAGVATAYANREADPVGPPIGNNRYKSKLERGPVGGADTDDYVGLFAAGDRLSVSVKSPFQSPLLPVIRLFDPDGIERTDEIDTKDAREAKGRSFKRFPIDKTGRWAVRIASILDTEGTYNLVFQVSPAPKAKSSGHRLGGDEPTERVHSFEAIGESTVDVQVKWAKTSAPVEIVAIEDPRGEKVIADGGGFADELARGGKRSTKLKKFGLPDESGRYGLRVRSTGGAAEYALTLRVRPPKRPGGRRKLSSVEPILDPPEFGLMRGVAEMTVRLRGWHFSAGSPPRVYFGENQGTEVIVHPSGGYLDVVVPEGSDDECVPVTVINPDGQGAAVGAYFYYVPPPVITDVTDVDGNPVRGADAAGGRLVRVHGEHLVSGQIVLFGDSPELVPILRDGALEVSVPPKPAGRYEIKITDAFGHEAVAPFDFELKAAPRIDAEAYTPAVATAGATTEILVRGANFEDGDTVFFDGEAVPFTFLSGSLLRFEVPVRIDGLYPVEIQDRFGLVGHAPDLRVKSPGVIDDVRTTAGPLVVDDGVSIHGGTVVVVDGSLFDPHDTVTLAGATVTPTSTEPGRIELTAPAAAGGVTDVTVTDAAGQATTATGALRYQGYAEATAAHVPARSGIDDLSAESGVVGDVDGDGDDDDLLIVSHDSSPGSRTQRLRLLIGGTNGRFSDRTGTQLPSSGSDSTATDDWRAHAVVLADLDPAAANGPEILLAGSPPDPTRTGELRVMRNDGSGSFTLDEDIVPGSTSQAGVTARDELGTDHVLYGPRSVAGEPSAMAVGDLDGDGDDDVVVGRTSFESRVIGLDEDYVDFTVTPPYVSSDDAAAHGADVTGYFTATRVFENDLDGNGDFAEVTDALPSVGNSGATGLPAFHCRDLALGDIDDDGDLDLVITWDDPTTVTAYGLASGSGTAQPQTATRVLLNDGNASFTDVTSTWMPSTVAPEFYQASQIALVDLDGDGNLDLVLSHADGVDAYQGPPGHTRYALRVLTGDGTGFTDVTATALPALPLGTNEDYRAGALLVDDVDGDGLTDILLGSASPIRKNGTNAALRATRLLLGETGGLTFRESTGFLPPLSSDSGEVDELLFLPDLAGNDRPSLILLGETAPATSSGSSFLRVVDWER